MFEWNGVESECEIRPMKRFIRWIPALFGPFEEVRLNGASPDLNPFIVARRIRQAARVGAGVGRRPAVALTPASRAA